MKKISPKSAAFSVVMATSFVAHAQMAPQCDDVFANVHAIKMFRSASQDASGEAHAKSVVAKVFGEAADDQSTDATIEALLKSRERSAWFNFKDTVSELFKDKGEVQGLVKPIRDPREGMLAKIMMMRRAQHTVDLTYYIFTKDTSGKALLDEAKDALRRGVSLRFMEDGLGTPTLFSTEIKALLDYASKNAGYVLDENGQRTTRKATISFVRFHPYSNRYESLVGDIGRFFLNTYNKATGNPARVDYSQWDMDRRSHDKLMIIDANFPRLVMAILGGRNLADHYYGLPEISEHTYRDLEVVYRNDPNDPTLEDYSKEDVGSLWGSYYQTIFFHLGNRQILRSLTGMIFGYENQYKKMAQAFSDLDDQTRDLQENLLGEDMYSPNFGDKYLSEGFTPADVELGSSFHNIYRSHAESKSGRGDMNSDRANENGIMKKFRDLAKTETKKITIISPYLWLSDSEINLLKFWLRQDPNRELEIFTNSILTTDNLPAQALVDDTLGPKLMMDEGLKDADGKVLRPGVGSQVKVWCYGKLDSITLGGTVPYGKLHAKGAILHDIKTSLVTTYNADPRSQFLNSEGGIFIRGDYSVTQMATREADDLRAHSHLWGSDEWNAIRHHPKLGEKKLLAIKYQHQLYHLLIKLHLWFLI